MGIFGPYVLAVWIGNFNGKGNQIFTGQLAAAPLFFQIVDGIYAQYPQIKEIQKPFPKNLKKVDICLPSGNLITQWCQQKSKTWFIPGKTPINVDTVFRPIVIDNQTNKPACPPYNAKNTHVEVFEFWSSDLLKLFDQAGIPKKRPPSTEHCLKSTSFNAFDDIHITNPSEYVTYVLNRNTIDTQFIPLVATVNADIQSIYWFANGIYLGNTSARASFEWHPSDSGSYLIQAIDDKGNSDQKRIQVSMTQ